MKILQKLGDSSRNQVKMGENELKISGLGGVWQTIPMNSEDLHSKTGKTSNKVLPKPKPLRGTKIIIGFGGCFADFEIFFLSFSNFGVSSPKMKFYQISGCSVEKCKHVRKRVCSTFCSTLLDVCSTFARRFRPEIF